MRHVLTASLATLLLAGSVVAEDLKSGPQVGSKKIPPFNPLHATGSGAGGKACLVWSNGGNPVAMIFAREITPALTSLVKKIDAATAKNSGDKMGSFVVFCSGEEGLEAKLKELAKKEGFSKTVLAVVENASGPNGYDLAKDADVTVVLYTNRTVKANYAFKKGELKEKDVESIVKDVSKILPEKK